MAAPTNPTEIVDALYEKLVSTFPPFGKRMSENGNGQYAALNARVEDLRGNYADLRRDMDARFTKLGDDLTRQADHTNARLDKIVSAIGTKSNGDKNGNGETRNSWIFGVAVTVAVAVIGGFIKYDHETITDKITQVGAALGQRIGQVEKQQDEAKKEYVGRSELTGWKNDAAASATELRRVQDDHIKSLASLESDVAYLKNDVERFKSIAVSRSEIDGNKNDTINRINLLSNRISEMSKDNSALPIVVENQRQIRSDLNELTRKFVTVPTYQK